MVNKNTNSKFFKILSIFTIWYGFSLKAISCYCPFNSRLSEALFEQMWRYTAQWSEETFGRCSRQRRHSKQFVHSTVRERYCRARICKRLRSPGILRPAYVAWRVSTFNRVVVPARNAGNRFLGSFKGLQIRLSSSTDFLRPPFAFQIWFRIALVEFSRQTKLASTLNQFVF